MSVRIPGNLPSLFTEGKLTNPVTTTVLADTGAIVPAIYEVRIIVGSSVAATFVVQRRDAANIATLGVVPVLYTVAGGSMEIILTYRLEASERIRVLPEANITGTAAATIQLEGLA